MTAPTTTDLTTTPADRPLNGRPGKPARAVRVEDALWHAAQTAAAARGETVSDVIRRALTGYVRRSATTTP